MTIHSRNYLISGIIQKRAEYILLEIRKAAYHP
jgi:hypothetical protein